MSRVTFDHILGWPLKHSHRAGDITNLETVISNFFGTWDASTGYPVPAGAGYWIISVAGTLGGQPLQPGDYLVWDGAAWDYVVLPHWELNTVVTNLAAGNNNVAHGLASTPRFVQFWYNDEMISLSYSRSGANLVIYSTQILNNVEINIIGS